MKLRRLRYWIADGWPIRIFFVLFIVGLPCAFGYAAFQLFSEVFDPFSGWWNLAQFLFYFAVSILLGLLVGLVVSMGAAPLLLLFLNLCSRLNGAPFKQGDRVRVLSGRDRDRVGQVISNPKPDAVEVEISGEREPRHVEGLCAFQLLRLPNSESEAAADKPSSTRVRGAESGQR